MRHGLRIGLSRGRVGRAGIARGDSPQPPAAHPHDTPTPRPEVAAHSRRRGGVAYPTRPPDRPGRSPPASSVPVGTPIAQLPTTTSAPSASRRGFPTTPTPSPPPPNCGGIGGTAACRVAHPSQTGSGNAPNTAWTFPIRSTRFHLSHAIPHGRPLAFQLRLTDSPVNSSFR